MSKAAQQWAELSRYDMDTARAMLDSGRFLYVLFCCQQAVEKMLKGLIARRAGEFPPRIHGLVRLAETAAITLEEERLDFLRKLSSYYIQTRYPEEIAALAGSISATQARETLRQTEEMIRWLESIP
jgi:HEPN domain-containing protein